MTRLLVTGTHGFIGSAFCVRAVRIFTVIPVSREDTKPLPKADILVHIAARTAKTKHDQITLATYLKDNVEGTKKLLKRLASIPSYVLYVSTMDVTKTPLTPYAKSKLEAERVITRFCTERNIPFCIARLGSVFGPGEGEYGKVIPTFIASALEGKPLQITDPNATRSFIFVRDVAKGLIKLIQRKQTGIVSIVGEKEISIGDLAGRIRTLASITSKKGITDFNTQLLEEIDWFRKERVLYFDVDGTLFNTWRRTYAVYKEFCIGQPVGFNTFKEMKRKGIPVKMGKEGLGRIEDADMLALDTVIPGMREVLDHLSSRFTLIALSARQSKEKLEFQLEHLGLRNYFQDVSTDKTRMRKGAVLVGDTEADIEAAKKGGILCISVSWGARDRSFLRSHGATRMLHVPRAIMRLWPAKGRKNSGSAT